MVRYIFHPWWTGPKSSECTKSFIEIGCLGTYNVELKRKIEKCKMENLSSFALLFQISKSLLEFKLFKTSRKRPYFEKNQLCECIIYAVPNLHTAPKRHLIKIRTFLNKIDSYLEKYKFARRFEGLKLKYIFCNT